MQQRCVPPLIVEWLLRYGAEDRGHHGAVRRYFDKKARKALAREVGTRAVALLSPILNTYVVESGDNGSVITVVRKER